MNFSVSYANDVTDDMISRNVNYSSNDYCCLAKPLDNILCTEFISIANVPKLDTLITPLKNNDSILKRININQLLKDVGDTLPKILDSIKRSIRQSPMKLSTGIQSGIKTKTSKLKDLYKRKWNQISDDSLAIKKFTLKLGKPLIEFQDAFLSYNYNYRSNIDTPFVEKEISQHTINANVSFTLAKLFPLFLNVWSRRSNSIYFKDITDVQFSFDPTRFQNNLMRTVREYLLPQMQGKEDSLISQINNIRKFKFSGLSEWVHNPINKQRVVEANELIGNPGLTYDSELPDSTNKATADSAVAQAKEFLSVYEAKKDSLVAWEKKLDTLEAIYNKNLTKIRAVQDMIKSGGFNIDDLNGYTDSAKDSIADMIRIPRSLKWLLGVRQLGIGRSPINYSELTAKNITVNGVNLEYNNRIYLAVVAGGIDYRFRDFKRRENTNQFQPFYMVRVGVGKIDRNYLILSYYQGRKILFNTSNNATRTDSRLNIAGVSIATQVSVWRNTFISGEVAESVSKDIHLNPAAPTSKFNLSNNRNRAYALKLSSYFPKTQTRFEGVYRYTGANFQSFSIFQSANAAVSWYARLEQSFLKRRIKINAGVRKNQFSNPYINNPYNSNIIFKNFQATFRFRKLPIVSIGYLPMSQLTKFGSEIVENQYQILNASIYHGFRVGLMRTSATFMLNKYFNAISDSSLLYYNSTNILYSQSFYFKLFSAGTSVSLSKNADYRLMVLEETITVPIKRRGTLGIGCKVNNLNQAETKVSLNFNAGFNINKTGTISIRYDKGYLPGFQRALVKSEMLSFQLVSFFHR